MSTSSANDLTCRKSAVGLYGHRSHECFFTTRRLWIGVDCRPSKLPTIRVSILSRVSSSSLTIVGLNAGLKICERASKRLADVFYSEDVTVLTDRTHWDYSGQQAYTWVKTHSWRSIGHIVVCCRIVFCLIDFYTVNSFIMKKVQCYWNKCVIIYMLNLMDRFFSFKQVYRA